MRHAEISDVYKPSRRSRAPLPALSSDSYSSRIRALYAAEYVRDRLRRHLRVGYPLARTHLKGDSSLALSSTFQVQILPHLMLTRRGSVMPAALLWAMCWRADRHGGPVIVQQTISLRCVGVDGTVLSVSLDELPDWLPAWCRDVLGGEPAGVLFQSQQVSMVFGLRLAGGREVVVKARADDGRAVLCVAAQARLAERGFPCARPLTPVVGVGRLAVHAEEYRPGGEVVQGDSPEIAMRCAEVFARLMAELAGVSVAPPLPNPPWVRWDHTDAGVWPAIEVLDGRDHSVVSEHIVHTAERARGRLLAAGLPCVLGHADFEAQNLRWQGWQVWAVHDWDSLAWQSEAALVGAASGSFASAGPPTLAPIEGSEAFLVAYQDIRGRLFTTVELEIAWAAGLWMAAYNAREMALGGGSRAGGDALRAQAAERLRRANA
jgi:hypothetical protein